MPLEVGNRAMKVLIVDDRKQILAIARARLAKDNLEVICAESGRSGLEMASLEKPDLIVLDVDMPDICGSDLCRKLKADPLVDVLAASQLRMPLTD